MCSGVRSALAADKRSAVCAWSVEQGPRKSLQPTLFRLGEPAARYESMQQFVADSPWSARDVLRRVESAWRRGWRSSAGSSMTPVSRRMGVARRGSSGSTRARSGRSATARSGVAARCRGAWHAAWAGRCICPRSGATTRGAVRPRSRRVAFQTKPQLARELIGQAATWEIPRGPILADSAYGDDGDFRVGLDDERLSYVVAISKTISVYEPDTEFTIPARGRDWPAAERRAC